MAGRDKRRDDRVEAVEMRIPGFQYAESGELGGRANQVNFGASRGSFLEPAPCSVRTKPPDVVWGVSWTATRGAAGWRGRIRTFDLLIQSLLLGISLASRRLSAQRTVVGRRIGVSQVPIPK